jgi:REP element-mobilizing transposase RayT
MGKWNHTDQPIAYLITFRTYGTWLHGDERGSIDRYHNKFQGPRAVASDLRAKVHRGRLKSPPLMLNANCRVIVESAVREVCAFRGWSLVALSVRTNHAHVVAGGNAGSAKMLNDFKSYSTRRMRERGEWKFDHSPWVDKGGRRNLWTEGHVDRAKDYVLYGQGEALPDFD